MAIAQIMVVEDEAITAKDIQYTLRSLGYAVPAVVGTGERAIARAIETQPDLVLMDIKLRGALDGVEAATAIRSQLDIPIVYLTAYADEQTLARAGATSPSGYLLKPFQEYDLRVVVEAALNRDQPLGGMR